jgi:hypothetical protein
VESKAGDAAIARSRAQLLNVSTCLIARAR